MRVVNLRDYSFDSRLLSAIEKYSRDVTDSYLRQIKNIT